MPLNAGSQPTPQQPQRLGVASTKNMWLAVLLGVAFGPLGLLYSTMSGAIIMFIVNLVIGLMTLGFVLILTWPVCGLWAFVATKSHNEKLLAGQHM